jgi:hypothetical protein
MLLYKIFLSSRYKYFSTVFIIANSMLLWVPVSLEYHRMTSDLWPLLLFVQWVDRPSQLLQTTRVFMSISVVLAGLFFMEVQWTFKHSCSWWAVCALNRNLQVQLINHVWLESVVTYLLSLGSPVGKNYSCISEGGHLEHNGSSMVLSQKHLFASGVGRAAIFLWVC